MGCAGAHLGGSVCVFHWSGPGGLVWGRGPQQRCLLECACVVTFSVSNLQSAKTIVHGSAATVTVEDGEVAVIRNVGKRQTLGPGRYKLEAPQQVWAWSFECLISPIVAAAFALASVFFFQYSVIKTLQLLSNHYYLASGFY